MPVKCTMLWGSAPCEKSAFPSSPGMRGVAGYSPRLAVEHERLAVALVAVH